jgi:hypothetical protein
MMETATTTVGLRASDVTGQKRVRASAVPGDLTVGELVQGLIERMQLAPNDADGRPLDYQARLEREGRHLLASETVADALRDDDELVITPSIDAGTVSAGC